MTTSTAPDNVPGQTAASWRHRLLPVDVWVALYLAATGVLLLLNAGDVDRPFPVVFRLAFFVALLLTLRAPVPTHGILRFLRLAYPVFLYPLFYEELDVLNRLITTSHFDPVVVDVERTLFRSQPSVSLREWLPQPWLAEILHFCYVSYYAFGPLVFIRLGVGRIWNGVAETATVMTATFVACYVWFIAFPVTGPFHHFSPPDPRTLGYVLPELTHWILHRGSSVGTAFPSSHVAIATAAAMQAWRWDRRVSGFILAALTPGLAVGAVYGGFHYATDALAGFLLALIMVWIGRRAHRTALRSVGGAFRLG